MPKLKEKLSLTTLTAGAIGWTYYGCYKFGQDISNMPFETTCDKLKTIGKCVLAGVCYGSACVADAILLAATITAWKTK